MKLNTAIAISVSAMLALAVGAPYAASASQTETVQEERQIVRAREGAALFAGEESLGKIFKVSRTGDVKIVINGKYRVIPAATISYRGQGAYQTSLTRDQVLSAN